MGKTLSESYPAAAEIFREADSALGYSLTGIMWEGPELELVKTENAQPAILAHSVAALAVLRDHLGPVGMGAGHSLGEFSALVAASALSFADALRTVRIRGQLMALAGSRSPGTMAAVLGMEDEAVVELCQEAAALSGTRVVPANFNSPGQVVISGDVAGIEAAVKIGPERGAKKVVALTVSGAFHSPLMQDAEAGLRDALTQVTFADPTFPVYSNVTAGPIVDPEVARDLLVRQLTSPVRWAASVGAMVEAGADRFIEVGPGDVLSGLNKRNARGVPSQSIGDPAGVATLTGESS
jgi:[acyl-carrier-protein] S-malonyltransferase